MITKRILITQNNLCSYAGSEIVTLELSEHALALGYDVDILTNYFGLPISNEFDKRVNIFGSDQECDTSKYSHIWIHHNIIPLDLLDRLRKNDKSLPKIAFHHMSPYVPGEFPIHYQLEKDIAYHVYFNSSETKDTLIGVNHDFKNAIVLGNPAPDIFYRDEIVVNKSKRPKNILVVSNHPPTELIDALKKLRKINSISYTLVGSSGEASRVTPESLDGYDLVISIGKTVQYSIVRGVPVFCYDHFGGSGYLSNLNFEKNSYFNFSGRGFKKKTSDEIVDEIVKGYQAAKEFMIELHKTKAKNYKLSVALKDFLNREINNNDLDYSFSDMELKKVENTVKILCQDSRDINHYKRENDTFRNKLSMLETVASETSETLLHYKEMYERTINYKAKKIYMKYSAKVKSKLKM